MKLNESNMAYFATAIDEDTLQLDSLSQEAVDASEENYNLFLQTIDNINIGLESGRLDEEEAATYRAQALADLQARLAGIYDVEVEYEGEDEEEADYSASDSNIANFEAGSQFGQALLELASEEYEDAIDGLMELADQTGLTDEEIVALIQGSVAPNDQLAESIGQFFDTTRDDEDALLGLMVLAAEAQEEVGAESEEDEEDVDDEEGEGDYRAAALEQRIANFEAQSVVTDALAQLEGYAEEGLKAGWLPPVAKQRLLGNFRRESDRLAAFSEGCDANEIDPQTQLFAIEYALSVFEKCGPLVKFGAYVAEEISEEEAEFASSAEQQALLNFQLMKENN